MGITQRALSLGVPVCVVPHGRDQFEVARRVERVEAGTFLHPKQLDVRNLERAFRRTLGRAAGAARLSSALCPRRGAERAASSLLAQMTGENA
jgi:UDP:flavonoid glycosyltransferase YjiC (YdhE family)